MSLSTRKELTVKAPAGAGEAPTLEVNSTPFLVDETIVETLTKGEGEVVPELANVRVDYHGVSGTTGQIFDSSWKRGQPTEFPLDGVVTGFKKAIAGQTVGSEVLVAMNSADGYGDRGVPQAGIPGGDTLIFFITIHEIV